MFEVCDSHADSLLFPQDVYWSFLIAFKIKCYAFMKTYYLLNVKAANLLDLASCHLKKHL